MANNTSHLISLRLSGSYFCVRQLAASGGTMSQLFAAGRAFTLYGYISIPELCLNLIISYILVSGFIFSKSLANRLNKDENVTACSAH